MIEVATVSNASILDFEKLGCDLHKLNSRSLDPLR